MEALVSAKGSDLHLKVGSPPRMRVDGRLVVLDGPVLTPEMADSLLRELIRPDLHDQFQQTNEAHFAYSLPGVGRFGINAFRQRGSVGLVLRRVQEGAMSIGELGLPPGDRPPGRAAPRPGAGHRPDRLGQDHHPCRHVRPRQRQPGSPYCDDRGSHRGPARRRRRDRQPLHRPIPPFQQRQVRLSLAAALRGIVGQRLVRRAVLEVMVNTGRTAEAIADPERTGDLAAIIAQVVLRSQGPGRLAGGGRPPAPSPAAVRPLMPA